MTTTHLQKPSDEPFEETNVIFSTKEKKEHEIDKEDVSIKEDYSKELHVSNFNLHNTSTDASIDFDPSALHDADDQQELLEHPISESCPKVKYSSPSSSLSRIAEDPCSFICHRMQLPQIGNSYILLMRKDKPFLVVGPHWIGFVITFSLLLFATIMFTKHQCSKLAPMYTNITIFLALSSSLFLFLTGLTDPGIVFSTGNVVVERYTRYCDQCNVVQKLNVEHCDDCGYCIEGYDHHCPWMGKCIGKKNFVWFLLFNCSWTIYLIFVIILTMQNLNPSNSNGK